MKKKMMPVDEVTWIVIVGFIMIMVVASVHISKPKVIAPSGPGPCDVACCIELMANGDLDTDIKNSRRGME